MLIRIGLIGDYDATVKAHIAIPKALEQSAGDAGVEVEAVWLATESIPEIDLGPYDAMWCVPHSPYRSKEGALKGIRFARETGRPLLGTCAGFQHALIEYARNVLGLKTADHEETNPHSDEPVITQLACPLVEAEETIRIIPGTKLAGIYGLAETREGYHCRFGLNPKYRPRFEAAGVRTNAVGPEEEVRGMEWQGHPFFIGVLFQPERWALSGQANPLVTSFVAAAAATRREHDQLDQVGRKTRR